MDCPFLVHLNWRRFLANSAIRGKRLELMGAGPLNIPTQED